LGQEQRGTGRQIIAVCGKGGVGKTVFCALLGKALIDSGVKPVLLIDGDPAGGLTSAIGERSVRTLANVRDDLISSARLGRTTQTANLLDYLLLEALVERPGYSLLAMGHSKEKGCFCPANELLRGSIDALAPPFAAVLIDGEAGIEQINRSVTRRVTRVIVIIDGSQRSIDTSRLIVKMVEPVPVSVVANRMGSVHLNRLAVDAEFIGSVPQNEELRQLDGEGRSLWELPPENEATKAVRNIAQALGLLGTRV
jgi:CO dehydrogenase maturation factor